MNNFSEFPSIGLQPNAVIFNILIRNLCYTEGLKKDAEPLFSEMKRSGTSLEPTAFLLALCSEIFMLQLSGTASCEYGKFGATIAYGSCNG